MLRTWAFVLLLAAFSFGKEPKKQHRDYVPDEKTAVRIGEAVLIAQFGEEQVKAQFPLRASNAYRDVWIVQGSQPGPPQKGGNGLSVMINKHSGCVVSVMERMK